MSEAVAIDAALVERLVAAQLPRWRDLPVRPVARSGHDNRTFHLGDDMLVRLPSSADYAAQVDKEQRWLPVLAPRLPLEIPAPLAQGRPSDDFPHPWSVYRWIEGETVAEAGALDEVRLAADLAAFLRALQAVDAAEGPAAGRGNFFRGGPLAVYDPETRRAMAALADETDVRAAREVWEAALEATWRGPRVWVHGDVAPGNLLVREGRLCAVIDFGCAAVGDPACDLAIAWNRFTGESREAFREALPLDAGTWARGRGWTLWKALILAAGRTSNPRELPDARRVLEDVLADHALHGA